MNRDPQNGLQCSQFEALLADALDDANADADADAGSGAHARHRPKADAETGSGALTALSAEVREAFEAHRQSCADCRASFAEALEGMLLLREIAEVEPPKNLVHNILAATSLADAPAQAAAKGVQRAGWAQRLLRSFKPATAGFLRSRFAASFCMAFFSLSLSLNLAGVKVGDLLNAAQHPSTVRKSLVLEYTNVEAKVMRYYDNMRLVYEVRLRVQELKKVTTPQNNNNNNRPEQQNWNHSAPRQHQEEQENLSQERNSSLIAQSTVHREGAQL
jgi:hypothetical protein